MIFSSSVFSIAWNILYSDKLRKDSNKIRYLLFAAANYAAAATGKYAILAMIRGKILRIREQDSRADRPKVGRLATKVGRRPTKVAKRPTFTNYRSGET